MINGEKMETTSNKKEMISQFMLLLQKWEESYIQFLTQKANDFQERNQSIRNKINQMLLDAEDTWISEKQLKKIEKKIKQNLKLMEKNKVCFKKNLKTLNKIMEKI